jgi:hypothetical protein
VEQKPYINILSSYILYKYMKNDTIFGNKIINLSKPRPPFLTSRGERYNLQRRLEPWQWQFPKQSGKKGQAGGQRYRFWRSCSFQMVGVPQV